MLKETLERLLHITDGCRPDMHEPDEQDISAHVVGDHLDNAFGNCIDIDAILKKNQEYVVVINRDGTEDQFNLADLIALARMADVQFLHTPHVGDEWQPIETAPKDGTRVLLYFVPNEIVAPKKAKIAVGYNKKCQWQDGTGKKIGEPFNLWHSDEDLGGLSYAPTHWKPLPTPPQENE